MPWPPALSQRPLGPDPVAGRGFERRRAGWGLLAGSSEQPVPGGLAQRTPPAGRGRGKAGRGPLRSASPAPGEPALGTQPGSGRRGAPRLRQPCPCPGAPRRHLSPRGGPGGGRDLAPSARRRPGGELLHAAWPSPGRGGQGATETSGAPRPHWRPALHPPHRTRTPSLRAPGRTRQGGTGCVGTGWTGMASHAARQSLLYRRPCSVVARGGRQAWDGRSPSGSVRVSLCAAGYTALPLFQRPWQGALSSARPRGPSRAEEPPDRVGPPRLPCPPRPPPPPKDLGVRETCAAWNRPAIKGGLGPEPRLVPAFLPFRGRTPSRTVLRGSYPSVASSAYPSTVPLHAQGRVRCSLPGLGSPEDARDGNPQLT